MLIALVGGAVGATAIALVNAASAIRRLFGLEPESRPLTTGERSLLFPIFRTSINYTDVRITEGDLGVLNGLEGRPYTVGSRILVPSASCHFPIATHPATLVHEATHVWQFQQSGPAYVPKALMAQYSGEVGKTMIEPCGRPVTASAGYAFDVAVAAGKHWPEFNPEQQAEFLQVAFLIGVDFDDPARGAPMQFDGVDYTSELLNALASIRTGEGAA